MPGKVKDIAGLTFGRVEVLSFAGTRNKKALWNCRCSCGTEFVAVSGHLLSGNTKSCGCYKRARSVECNTKYWTVKGGSSLGAYRSWCAMRTRCLKPSNEFYERYGGRGIKICDRWLGDSGFPNFVADMGERPIGHTLERVDVNGNYEPSNCVWLPMNRQGENRTNTVRWVLDGQVLIQSEVARRIHTHRAYLTRWRRDPATMPAALQGRLTPLQEAT